MASLGDLIVSVRATASEYAADIRKIQRETSALEQSVRPATRAFNDFGAAATRVGAGLTAAVTVPLVAITGLSIKAASDFESSFAGVRKTVDATEAEFGKLAQGFRDMSKEIPTSVNELNRIGEAAGQLGISKENILGFTRTMAELSVTTNLTSDQAATAIAQIQNIFGTAGKDVDRFGATLVALGNAGASTEKDIVDMSLRIAGAGTQVGLTQGEVLAFASSLSSVGINAEAGGSAISRVFLKINDAVQGGGDALDEFARVAGVSSADFKRSFETDAAGATTAFIGGLARIKGEGENVNATLEGLVGKNIIIKDTLNRAAGAGELLTNNLTLQKKAWEENSALTNEAAERYKTFESQLKIFKQQLQDVGITLGNALLPALKSMLTAATPAIEIIADLATKFSELPTPVKAVAVGVVALGAAIGPVLGTIGLMSTGIGSMIPILIKAGGAITAAGGLVPAITALGGKLLALAVAGGPIIAVTLALGALTYQLITVAQHMSAIEDAHDTLATAETQSQKNILKTVEILRSQGHVIDTTGKSMAALEAEVRKIAQSQAEMNRSETKAWFDSLEPRVTSTAKTMGQFRAEIAGVKVGMRDLGGATGDATADLEEQAEATKKATAATTEQWEAINDLIAKVQEQQALETITIANINSQNEAYAGLGRNFETNIGIMERSGEKIQELIDANKKFRDEGLEDWSAYQEALNKTNDTLDDGQVKLRDYSSLIAPPEVTVRVQKQASDLDKAFSNAFNSVKETGKLIWTDIIRDGEFKFGSLATAVKGIFQTLASEVLSIMTAKLITPLVTNITNSLSGILGKIPGLSGVFGGVAAGGGAPAGGAAAGGGGAAAGFFTNPWTIGIGAALGVAGLAINKWVGQGRKTADRFVKEFQNPFNAAVAQIHDAFFAAAAAGELTSEEAEEARTQVTALWTTFKSEAEAFARQGENEAKVVSQAFATVSSVWGEDLGVIVGGFDSIIVTLKEQETALENTIASNEDFTDSLETGGEAIRFTVDDLDDLGRSAYNAIDPISALANALDDLASSARSASSGGGSTRPPSGAREPEVYTPEGTGPSETIRTALIEAIRRTPYGGIVKDLFPEGLPLPPGWEAVTQANGILSDGGGTGLSDRFVLEPQEGHGTSMWDEEGHSYSPWPTYRYGTNFVPRTGPAIVHEGERIIPASENQSSGPVTIVLQIDGREVARATLPHQNDMVKYGGMQLVASEVR